MSVHRSFRAATTALVCAFVLAACTASHDVSGLGQSLGSAGSGGSAGNAGSAGSAGMAGASAGSGGTGGTATAGAAAAGRGGSSGAAGTGTIACGATCTAPAILGLIQLTACCTTENRCGVDLSVVGSGCVAQNAPGNLDSSCPADSLSQPGCCRPDGTCGTMDSFANLGCIDSGTGTTQQCTPK